MRAALAYVAAHPGCSKSDAVRAVSGPVIRLEPVERLIRLGWVKAEEGGPRGGFRLFLTEQGSTAHGEAR
jgi:hypothetical protein